MHLAERLASLQEEYGKGERLLAEIDERRREVRDTLLRISGAIQVLREVSGQAEGPAAAICASPSDG
jgi:hypothetical protein